MITNDFLQRLPKNIAEIMKDNVALIDKLVGLGFSLPEAHAIINRGISPKLWEAEIGRRLEDFFDAQAKRRFNQLGL